MVSIVHYSEHALPDVTGKYSANDVIYENQSAIGQSNGGFTNV